MPSVPFTQWSEIRSSPNTFRWAKPGILHDLAEFHVVEHFHAQRPVRSDRVINRTPHHVECAHSHVILRLRVGNFPRPMAKYKERLKKSDHHPLARMLHDHAWKQNHMIGLLALGIRNHAPDGIGLEHNIGVCKQQPIPSRLLSRRPHGMRFAHPTGGQF